MKFNPLSSFETNLFLAINNAREHHKGAKLLILVGSYESSELNKITQRNDMFIDAIKELDIIKIIQIPLNYTLTVMPEETYKYLRESSN